MRNTSNDSITLKNGWGDFVAYSAEARDYANSNSLRQLRNTVRDFWPELWNNEAEWKPWIRTLSKLELAVIIKQL